MAELGVPRALSPPAQKEELSAERKADQAAVDGALKPNAQMTAYLKDRFSLGKHQAPHTMKF